MKSLLIPKQYVFFFFFVVAWFRYVLLATFLVGWGKIASARPPFSWIIHDEQASLEARWSRPRCPPIFAQPAVFFLAAHGHAEETVVEVLRRVERADGDTLREQAIGKLGGLDGIRSRAAAGSS